LNSDVVAFPGARLPPIQFTSESLAGVPVLYIAIPGAPDAMAESLTLISTLPLRSAIKLLPTTSSSIKSFTAHPDPAVASVVEEPATLFEIDRVVVLQKYR
jgi:hypothetical protein